jgi:hypothetical protein
MIFHPVLFEECKKKPKNKEKCLKNGKIWNILEIVGKLSV